MPPLLRRLPILLLAGAALLALGARPRPGAQCTTQAQAEAVAARLAEGVACNEQALASGQAGCSVTPPPSCAGSLVADVLALGWGAQQLAPLAHDPGTQAEAFACQTALGRAAADYASSRLALRVRRLPPASVDPEVRPLLDPVLQHCSVTVTQSAAGLVLPGAGVQCAAALGPPGAAVDPARLAGCLETLLSLWVERVAPSPRPLRPNVVLILTDDQRFDSVGPEHGIGGADVMPAVRSQIGGEGVEFSRAFVTTPLCCPSRASLLTGQYAHTTGVHDNEMFEELDDSSTLATWLAAAGYRTGLYGKYLNGYRGVVLAGNPYVPPGWSDWHAFVQTDYFDYSLLENGVEVPYGSAPGDYATDVLRDKAIAFVRDAVAQGQPFYLHYTPIAPHTPATPAPRHLGLFAGLAPFRPPSWNEPDVNDKPGWGLDPISVGAQGALDALRQRMLETLRAVDEAAAALLAALREEGVLDDTLVIFTSDNGYHWGEHQMIGKGSPFDEATRVPLLIRYPRLAPLPRAEPRFALNVDLAPTIAELAGAQPTHAVEGRSLVRVLDGTARDWRTHVLSEGWVDENVWAGVRDGRWKYHEKQWGAAELYDLESDPFELQSLGKAPAFKAQRLAMATLLAGLRPELFACADGLDNDGNGRVDMDDPGCEAPGDHAELSPRCGLGFELVLLVPLLARWRRARRAC